MLQKVQQPLVSGCRFGSLKMAILCNCQGLLLIPDSRVKDGGCTFEVLPNGLAKGKGYMHPRGY